MPWVRTRRRAIRESHLPLLACPACRGELAIAERRSGDGDRLESGRLACVRCRATYEVSRFVPRFVPAENYASGFGLEWSIHARTQYDSHTGLSISETRFFEETRWPRQLVGEKILEVGCGSGRFTEQALETGAFVASMDYSNAVDVNYANNGPRDNLLVVQGDIYAIPFRRGWFDKLYCIGVIQHTPDPESAFLSLPPLLRDGGELVIDVYKRELRKLLSLKYWARPLTRRMQPEALYRATRRYVDIMWPLASRIRKIPKVGPMINWSLCVADHSRLGLTGELLKEWAYLDTFDMLSPRYDRPQSIRTVTSWFAKAGMRDVEVHDGYNGIEARGKRP